MFVGWALPTLPFNAVELKKTDPQSKLGMLGSEALASPEATRLKPHFLAQQH